MKKEETSPVTADEKRAERAWVLQHGVPELLAAGCDQREAHAAAQELVQRISAEIDELEGRLSPVPALPVRSKRGRPALAAGKRADVYLHVRVPRERKASYVRAAHGQPLTEWILDALDAKAAGGTEAGTDRECAG